MKETATSREISVDFDPSWRAACSPPRAIADEDRRDRGKSFTERPSIQ
jgi:hypothetical protein